ncbi:hypothetical protein OQX63_17250 [Pedobacter sp. PF22-3]|uniref:hypothetical protein n=1 Tax=Pedobacter sp. PF22-3 TaxID=2994467 RepID=UPI00224799C0|nr:hypothetical protein [Pedobacter sp. PF22-3]MCX2495240.1 hypothetical protein [Pedobacter sp. PF22-3]
MRDKIWSDIKQRHDQVISAFRTKENLPESYSRQIDKELKDFSKDWAIPEGIRYKAMAIQHQKQFEDIAGKPSSLDKSGMTKSSFEQSLASTKAKQKSAQREKHPEKFADLDCNKESMDLEKD